MIAFVVLKAILIYLTAGIIFSFLYWLLVNYYFKTSYQEMLKDPNSKELKISAFIVLVWPILLIVILVGLVAAKMNIRKEKTKKCDSEDGDS